MTPISNRWFNLVVAIAALAVGLALLHLSSLAGFEVQQSYNEGWNAYHALAARTGKALYPTSPSLMFNNYPPLSFFVTAALGKIVPDLVTAGRIVSLLAAMVSAGAVFAIARRMGAAASESVFAAALFLAKLLAASNYIGINDPQLLGHALGSLGFLAAIARPRRTLLAALLLTLAVFVKHMLIVQPLVLLIWLVAEDRRGALRFFLFGTVFAFVGFFLCRIGLGVNLFEVLFTPREFRLSWIWPSLIDFLLVSFAPFGAGIFLLLRPNTAFERLCGLYTVLAFVIGLIFDGGAGVGRNALFDAAIASALSAALLVHRWKRPVFALLFALACLVPPGVATWQKIETSWLSRSFWLNPMAQQISETRASVAFLKAQKGPVMCEHLALCYWAGKPAQVDMFNFAQAVLAKSRDAQDLIRLLNAHYFAAVETSEKSRLEELPQVMSALARNYRPAHKSFYGVIYVPREPL